MDHILANCRANLVPRACDPWEGNEGSGIIRCRKPGIVAKIELRIHFNGQSESSLKRIIPEPSFPSRGSQARGTRLIVGHAATSAFPNYPFCLIRPAFPDGVLFMIVPNLGLSPLRPQVQASVRTFSECDSNPVFM